MKDKNNIPTKPLPFQGHTTVSAGKILSFGDTDAYSKSVKHDPKKLFKLPGEAITEDDLKAALDDLARK